MDTKITRDVLEGYLKRRYKAHLQLGGNRGQKTDYEGLQLESRERVRLAGTELLLARRRDTEVLRNLIVTRALLKRAVPLLLASR
jgi:hypothetical protein